MRLEQRIRQAGQGQTTSRTVVAFVSAVDRTGPNAGQGRPMKANGMGGDRNDQKAGASDDNRCGRGHQGHDRRHTLPGGTVGPHVRIGFSQVERRAVLRLIANFTLHELTACAFVPGKSLAKFNFPVVSMSITARVIMLTAKYSHSDGIRPSPVSETLKKMSGSGDCSDDGTDAQPRNQ